MHESERIAPKAEEKAVAVSGGATISRTGKCVKHDKEFASHTLLSNPPLYTWICRICGEEGTDKNKAINISKHDKLKESFSQAVPSKKFSAED